MEGAGNREQGARNREQGTGSREQGVGNKEQGAGNREEGTESREPGTERALGMLLDGYFHEDFRAEYGGHEGAARAFVRDASLDERRAAAEALARFIEWADGVERPRWQAGLRRFGGAWRPRSLLSLREVLAILR